MEELNCDVEKVYQILVKKYYFLREDFIQNELDYLIESINDFWFEEDIEKLDDEGLVKAFGERMLDYLKEGFFESEVREWGQWS